MFVWTNRGAYVSCKACGDSNHKKLVKCNISMHPSVSSNAFKESDVDIMNAVNCPQMIYSTPMEPKSWHPEGDISKLLESKVSIAGKNEFGMYNQTHGFVTRGSLDPASPVSKDIGDAIQKSINFFHKNLD